MSMADALVTVALSALVMFLATRGVSVVAGLLAG
jgi:hypothetical protein